MSQKSKPPSHLKQSSDFRRKRNASGWVGFIDWLEPFHGADFDFGKRKLLIQCVNSNMMSALR
jgi:hypothetical protein